MCIRDSRLGVSIKPVPLVTKLPRDLLCRITEQLTVSHTPLLVKTLGGTTYRNRSKHRSPRLQDGAGHRKRVRLPLSVAHGISKTPHFLKISRKRSTVSYGLVSEADKTVLMIKVFLRLCLRNSGQYRLRGGAGMQGRSAVSYTHLRA